MEKSSFVVTGEASESDTEEEINYPSIISTDSTTPKLSLSATHKGKIVIGEAPESDEELEVSISGELKITKVLADDKNSSHSTKMLQKHEDRLQFKTLLHKKLRERNISLHKNINEFIRHTVGNAGRELNTANQQLLRSQVQLQEAVSALNTLHSNTAILKAKLSSITSASFLPQITIPD